MKWLPVVCLVVPLFTGCLVPTYTLKHGTTIDELGVCVDYDASIADSIQKGLDSVTHAYIIDHNRKGVGHKLAECTNPNRNSVKLSVNKVSFITPAHRAASVLVTMAGCITPFAMIAAEAPFYLWFAYFPKNVTVVRGSLSSDINGTPYEIPMESAVRSGGALVPQSMLKTKNERAFYDYLENSLTNIGVTEKTAMPATVAPSSQQKIRSSTIAPAEGPKEPSPWDYLDSLGSDDPYLRRK